jgi:hypothetical protein
MAAFVSYGMEAAGDCNVLGRKRKTPDLAVFKERVWNTSSKCCVIAFVYYVKLLKHSKQWSAILLPHYSTNRFRIA